MVSMVSLLSFSDCADVSIFSSTFDTLSSTCLFSGDFSTGCILASPVLSSCANKLSFSDCSSALFLLHCDCVISLFWSCFVKSSIFSLVDLILLSNDSVASTGCSTVPRETSTLSLDDCAVGC